MKEPVEKLLFSIGEAAEMLNIGRSTAYELIKQGDLPSVKISRRRLIPRAALMAWLANKIEDGKNPDVYRR
jgi:excisionase family DNA binding protein